MKYLITALIMLAFCLHNTTLAGTEAGACPVTLGAQKRDASPFPEFDWYGTPALAASAPANGNWPATRPGHAIAVKLFWWSESFRIGMESELEVAIASLHGNPAAPVVSRATNAFSEELEQTGPWAMLVGVDFPEPGCFKVIGRFRGETLEFVVEVLEIDPAPRGSQLLAPFKRDLQQALSAGMSRGPVEAISACRVEAPEIARSLSRDGVRVGRSSHRLRNPANVAPEWVAPIMDAYRADSANREPTTRALGEGRAGYVEPIVVQPLCTTCHGETPADEIATRLTELYPQDRATGYRVGELRGVFWVEYPTGK